MVSFSNSSIAAVTALAMCLVAGCSSAPTEILVTVNSDFAVPSQLDHVVVQSTDASGATVSTRQFFLHAGTNDTGDGTYALPLSFAIVPENGDISRRANLNIQGFAAGATTPLVERKAIMGFVKGEKLPLEVFLAAACVGVTCPSDQTCDVGGTCVPIVVSGDAHDAGVDGAVQPDAGTTGDMSVGLDASLHDGGVRDAANLDASDGARLDLAISDDASSDLGVADDGAMPFPHYATTPLQTITGPSGGGDHFGVFLAVSADATTLAVAAGYDIVSHMTNGQIFIFTGDGTGFSTTPSQSLSAPSNITGFGFRGIAVSVAASRMFVCAEIMGSHQGVVLEYMTSGFGQFSYSGTSLNFPSTVEGDDVAAVATIGDGSIVIASSWSSTSVFVYDGSSGSFPSTPDETLTAPGGAANGYGYGVAVSGDEGTLLVSDNASDTVGAYVYTSLHGVFPSAPSARISGTGTSVAIRGDGNEYVLGDASTTSVKVYRSSGGSYSLEQTIHDPTGTDSTFGASVAVTDDGRFVIVGDETTTVYVFQAE